MAETSSSSSSSATKKTDESGGLPLDVLGQLLSTVSMIAQHQAISQGGTNKADVGDNTNKRKAAGGNSGELAMSPLENLMSILNLGDPKAAGADAVSAAANAGSGGGGKSGGDSAAGNLISIIKMLAV